jgi:azobenzene reductase
MIEMKIVAFAGSLNRDSNTLKGLKVAAEAARKAGAEVEFFDLRERPLPIYDPESDEVNEHVAYFRKIMTEADAFLLGSPEYHNGVSGAFKNALDFVGSTQFGGKPVGRVAAAGGAVATNTLNQMLTMLRSLHAYVVPQFGSVGGATQFKEDGSFVNPDMQARFEKIGTDVVRLAKALREIQPVK